MTTKKSVLFQRFLRAARLILVALQLPTVAAIHAADAGKVVFDVPAGKAAQSLKQFAEQAKREIMFPVESVGEISTNALHGEFTVTDGLNQLLAGTKLRSFEDERTGAIIVTEEAGPKTQNGGRDKGDLLDQNVPANAVSNLGKQALPAVDTPIGETIELAPVTVEATLRSEPLLAIPVSVAVIDGDKMVAAGLNNLYDAIPETPSVTYRGGASNKDTSLFIRGVGNTSSAPAADSDVSFVVDGVVLTLPGQATMGLVDVDHIEVLKGPQGTLFGKNSSAGVISVVTKDPSGEKHGFLDMGYYGGGGEETVRGGISGAIVPHKLTASISLLFDDYGGNVKNIFFNRTVNGHQTEGGRVKFVFTPSTSFKATVTAYCVDERSTPTQDGPAIIPSTTAFPSGVVTLTNPAVLNAILPVVPSLDNTTVNSGWYNHVIDLNLGASAKLEWTASDFTVTSITAYQHWYNNQFGDTGIIPFPVVGQTVSWDDGHLWLDEYSEELRLTSPSGGFLTYVAGLYYQRADYTEHYRRNIIQEPTAGNLVPNFGESYDGITSNNYAAYGESTWNFTKKFRAVTGLRLTRDTRGYHNVRWASSPVAVPGIQPALGLHGGYEDADGVTARAGLQYDLAENTMAFATYSKGYKGPAFNVFLNQTALQEAPLLPVTSDSYEVGLKSQTWRNRIQATLSVFETFYRNYQANFQTTVAGSPVTNLINAGNVSTRGIEADLRARVTSNLTVSATASRINARIDEFFQPPGAGAPNVNGQELPFAPRFKMHGDADYRIPLSGTLDLDLGTDYSWQTKEEFQLTETPDTMQSAYGIWNASVSVTKPTADWKIALLVKNIANKHYASYIQQGSGFCWREVPRDNDRYFGGSLSKSF